MKVMTAREAKNRFGEFLDASRREPVVITKNDRPVGIMVSIEDAADTLLPEFLLDKTPGYDGWLFEKVTATLERLDAGGQRRLSQLEFDRRFAVAPKPRNVVENEQLLEVHGSSFWVCACHCSALSRTGVLRGSRRRPALAVPAFAQRPAGGPRPRQAESIDRESQ